MGNRYKTYKTYKNRTPWKVALGIFFGAVVLFIVLSLFVFFGFKKYIVYSSDGLHLEIPWLEELNEKYDNSDPYEN